VNPKCPFCGAEALVAEIHTYFYDVPLSENGYCYSEGEVSCDEIINIKCKNCGKQVPIEHYLND